MLALLAFVNAEASEVDCEKIDKCYIEDIDRCCYMNKATTIASRDTTLAVQKDEALQGVNFADNPKIEFLPNKIYKQVPNLIHYHAFNASIKEISKKNFQNLVKMEYLYLTLNKIESVDNSIFEGLVELREVRLGETTFLTHSTEIKSTLAQTTTESSPWAEKCSWEYRTYG